MSDEKTKKLAELYARFDQLVRKAERQADELVETQKQAKEVRDQILLLKAGK